MMYEPLVIKLLRDYLKTPDDSYTHLPIELVQQLITFVDESQALIKELDEQLKWVDGA